VLGAVAAGTVVAAAAGSPWYLVGTAATVCALVWLLRGPVRLATALARLEEPVRV
jgi:hypothetical protein